MIEAANLQVHSGQKLGLVGANGCGKSSLLALLRGELEPDSGDIELPAHWVVAHVAQDALASGRAAIEHALDGDVEFREVEAEIAAAEAAHDGERLAHAHERMREIEGYGARSRAATILDGLGFSASDLVRPLAEFSGGWRMRLHLAQALMRRSDLLLLDEPTNHLDLDAIVWLEGWLRQYRGTLVVVSHDRDFLDAVVGIVLHIENRTLRAYRGNYSDFESQRAAQLAMEQALQARQARERARMQAFIERFRAKATKARQAQSRLKALARMDMIIAAHADNPFSFGFAEPATLPDPMLALEGASAGYGESPVVSSIELVVRAGARIGLLGRNGAGKSTLIKLLAGELAPMSGARREAKGLSVGYFSQHQLEQLRADEPALAHLARLDPLAREQSLRDFLGTLGFSGDLALAPVETLSGGEKARLVLALLVWQRPNLLLLDEPTNHLDLEMREALTVALQEYEGAVVLVSHDRHLLRTTADTFLLVAGGMVTTFDGDLDDYVSWLAQLRQRDQTADDVRRARRRARDDADEERRALAARRRSLVREVEAIETEIASLGAEKSALDRWLGDSENYTGRRSDGLEPRLRRHAEIVSRIEHAEVRWLELQERLEEPE